MQDAPISQPNNVSTSENPVGRFMVAAGAVIADKTTGKILCIRRAAHLDFRPGEWEIVYGRIDQFEDLETGLRREIAEEVGITNLVVGDLLRHWHMYRGPETAENELIGITFHCVADNPTVALSYEHSEFAWLTATQALERITNEGIREDIRHFASHTDYLLQKAKVV